MPDNFTAPAPPQSLDSPLSGNVNTPDKAGVTGYFGDPRLNIPKAHNAGVFGISNEGDGVEGQSSSRSMSGVSGANSAGGIGVKGSSMKEGGVGIYGTGAGLAGQFVGPVQVTGNLTVGGRLNGHDVVELAKRIEALEQQVIHLLGVSGGARPQTGATGPLVISAQIFLRADGAKYLSVKGSGFMDRETVMLTITGKTFQNLNIVARGLTGEIEYTQVVNCSESSIWRVKAEGQQSRRISNEISALCD